MTNPPDKKKTNRLIWLVVIIALVVFLGLSFVVVGALVLYQSRAGTTDFSTADSRLEKSVPETGLGEALTTPSAPSEESLEFSGEAPSSAAVDNIENLDTVTDQKVIKTGSLDLVVTDVENSAGQISDIAQEQQGFIQSSDLRTDDDGTQWGTIIIKVPADKFEESIDKIKDIADQITQEDISGQDVTEEYVDLQAQLKNYQAEEAQYLEILKRAQTIDEVLKVTDKIARVRGNIERVEGRIKYLENQTNLSTITAYLTQEPSVSVPSKEWRPWTVIKTAFQRWINFLQVVVNLLIYLVIFLGPPALIIWLVVWLVLRRRRRQAQK